MIKFRLNEFKAIAKWLDKKLPGPLAFFLKGWLYGLEERYIDAKVHSALDKAIAPLKPPEPSLVAPTFTSTPSEVEGLDIIELTRTRTEDEGRL
mgnify:CR=1 FL=1|tara:strand:- start:1784 stop:2065 length:282 start_codon:yes stop_codon:yes gene_type:complete